MSTPPQRRRRSRLMRLMRLSLGPLLLAILAGGVLTLLGACLPDGAGAGWRNKILWDAGSTTLVLCGALIVGLLWGGVYLLVVEASRGMPGLRTVEQPAIKPEAAADWEAWQRSLSALGFRHGGWFSLDDFDETHVSAWNHVGRPVAAYLVYAPVAGTFRLRIISQRAGGTVLVSSTRLTELSYPPPPGVYVQVRKGATAEELWAWHLEAERLFPAGEPAAAEPPALFVETSARWARHRRSDPTWLLAVEPFEECWRMYRLCGMPVREQIERGWAAR